jgi:hypothetical protein
MAEAGVVAQGSPTQEEMTAYHEAGHAVIAWVLGSTITEVTIVPGSEPASRPGKKPRKNLGHVRHVLPHGSEHYLRQIILVVAGPLAEEHWSGRPCTARGTDAEIIEAMRTLIERGPEIEKGTDGLTHFGKLWSQATQAAFTSWIRALTRDLLGGRGVWAAVQALAKKLLDRKTLTGPDAEAVIARHTGRLTGSLI